MLILTHRGTRYCFLPERCRPAICLSSRTFPHRRLCCLRSCLRRWSLLFAAASAASPLRLLDFAARSRLRFCFTLLLDTCFFIFDFHFTFLSQRTPFWAPCRFYRCPNHYHHFRFHYRRRRRRHRRRRRRRRLRRYLRYHCHHFRLLVLRFLVVALPATLTTLR